jgi:hypothetical protein
MRGYDLLHWSTCLSTFARRSRLRVGAPLWKRRPTVAKRRHWRQVIRALEESRPPPPAGAGTHDAGTGEPVAA